MDHHQAESVEQRHDWQQQRIGVGGEAPNGQVRDRRTRPGRPARSRPGPSAARAPGWPRRSSNAATVIAAAKHNSSSSALRRVGSGGVTVTGAWTCVVMQPPGSRCPAEVGVAGARHRLAWWSRATWAPALLGGCLRGGVLEAVLLGGAPMEEVGGAVALGDVVPLVAGLGDPGGEVARGGGQGGSRLLADNSFNCDSASSSVPGRQSGQHLCACGRAQILQLQQSAVEVTAGLAVADDRQARCVR